MPTHTETARDNQNCNHFTATPFQTRFPAAAAALPHTMPISPSVQLRAVLLKNLRLQNRNRGDLFREVVWPVLLLMVLVGIRSAVQNKSYDSQLDFWQEAISNSLFPIVNGTSYQNATSVLYAPCSPTPNDTLWRVAQQVGTTFGGVPLCFPCNAQADCANSMEAYFLAHSDTVFGGVVFTGDVAGALTAGVPVPYYIRMDGDNFLPGVSGTELTPSFHAQPDQTTLQYQSYFLPLQVAVERALLTLRLDTVVDNVLFDVSVQAVGGHQRCVMLFFFSPSRCADAA